MTVVGEGRLAALLADVDVEVPRTVRLVALEDATRRERIARYAADAGGRYLVWVFYESGAVFVLRVPRGAVAPCPRCLLFHVASSPDEVAVLRGSAGGKPDPDRAAAIASTEAFADALRTAVEPATSRWLAVVDSDSVRTRSAAVHRYTGCRHDGLPATGFAERRPVEDDADALRERFLDPYVGIVRRVDADPVGPARHLASAAFEHPVYHRDPDSLRPLLRAGGCGPTVEAARLRAVSEALERYAALGPAPEGAVCAASDLPERHLAPPTLFRYDDAQHGSGQVPFERYDPEARYNWLACRRLGAGSRVRVPSDYLYLFPARDRDHALTSANTGGCAAHVSRAAAVERAVTELVERDAVVRHWFARERRPRLAAADLPEEARDDVARLRDVGYAVSVVDVTRFPTFPCYEVVCVRDDRSPRVVAASACALDAADALDDALDEVFETLATDVDEPPDRGDVSSAADHLAYYDHPERVDVVRAFVEEATEPGGAPRSGPAESVNEAVAGADLDVVVRDLAPSDVGNSGVAVVRAVSPDLAPLTFGADRERLDHPDSAVRVERRTDRLHPFP